MRVRRFHWWAALLIVLALAAAACGDDDGSSGGDGDKGSVVVGSTDFTEQFIVASMYGQLLEANGYDVEVRSNLGSREVVFPSLESGELDLVAEYVSTLLSFLTEGEEGGSGDLDDSLGKLDAQLEARGLVALEPAPAEDKNALAVTQATADELGIATTSDLAPIAGDLTFGGPPECPEREFCIIGLEEVYGITFGEFFPLDVGGPITMEALESGEIDVALVFSSDGQIAARGFVILEDDQGLQGVENLTPVISADVVNDEITELLNSVSAVLTTDKLSELNRRVGVDLEDPEDVALDFLVTEGLVDG